MFVRRFDMSAGSNNKSSQRIAKYVVTFLVGIVFFFTIWCAVSLFIYPGYRVMYSMFLGPIPVSQGVWACNNNKGSTFIHKSSEYIIESHVDNGLPAVVEVFDLDGRSSYPGSGLYFVVHGAKLSKPAVIPLELDGLVYRYVSNDDDGGYHLVDLFDIVPILPFKNKYILYPKNELVPGAYAISLVNGAEPWDKDPGSAIYPFLIQE
jgi:hypothetical protein